MKPDPLDEIVQFRIVPRPPAYQQRKSKYDALIQAMLSAPPDTAFNIAPNTETFCNPAQAISSMMRRRGLRLRSRQQKDGSVSVWLEDQPALERLRGEQSDGK